jgi:hypothetical protein
VYFLWILQESSARKERKKLEERKKTKEEKSKGKSVNLYPEFGFKVYIKVEELDFTRTSEETTLKSEFESKSYGQSKMEEKKSTLKKSDRSGIIRTDPK